MSTRATDRSGWTGGQYSLVRAAFGLGLLLTFARLLPAASELYSSDGVLAGVERSGPSQALAPLPANALLWLGLVASGLVALGYRARVAALACAVPLALLSVRNPLTVDSGAAFLGWCCLFHAALPPAPFGSLDARDRLDPRGGWSLPQALHRAAWIVLAGTTLYSGLLKALSPQWRAGTALGRLLTGPLVSPSTVDWAAGLAGWVLALGTWAILAFQLLFAPLALVGRARPLLWIAMALASLGVVWLADSPDAGFGRLALLALCFTPAWVPPVPAREPELVLYDGSCGLCHRAVRFVLAEDAGERPRFRFAPIGGPTFQDAVPAELHDHLPDSVLVLTEEGELLDRSRAAMRLMVGLGGVWRVLGLAAEAVPLALRDSVYDGIARVRHRLFATPDEACPLLPPELRERFDP